MDWNAVALWLDYVIQNYYAGVLVCGTAAVAIPTVIIGIKLDRRTVRNGHCGRQWDVGPEDSQGNVSLTCPVCGKLKLVASFRWEDHNAPKKPLKVAISNQP